MSIKTFLQEKNQNKLFDITHVNFSKKFVRNQLGDSFQM